MEHNEESTLTRKMVNEDTDNATSLSESGPTTAGMDRTFKKLLFPCQGGGTLCNCTDDKKYTLNQLMPTLVGDVKKDLCITAYNSHMQSSVKKKGFKISVCNVRNAEKYAVTLEDQNIRRERGVAKVEDNSRITLFLFTFIPWR